MRSKETIITSAMLILITYTIALSLVSQAFPAAQNVKTLSSTGNIQIQTSEGIGIYSEYQCVNELTTVSWGTLVPGATQTVVFYIKNEGSSSIILSLDTDNWSPSSPVAATDYLNLYWNYNNQPINPNQVVSVVVSLSADANIHDITSFSFDMLIVGN